MKAQQRGFSTDFSQVNITSPFSPVIEVVFDHRLQKSKVYKI